MINPLLKRAFLAGVCCPLLAVGAMAVNGATPVSLTHQIAASATAEIPETQVAPESDADAEADAHEGPDFDTTGGDDAAPDVSADPIDQALEPDAVPEAPADRATLLEELYRRLAESTDDATSETLEKAIGQVWLRSGSDTIDLLMERSAILQEKGDVGLALSVLRRVTELAPDYAEGWNRRAFVFFSEGDYSRALADLQRTLTIDRKHFQAISGLATILRELGDDAAALKAYRKVLELHPRWDTALKAVEELSRKVEGQGI